MNRLPSNLAFLMREEPITEYKLAQETGVNQPTIHRMVTGESKDPRETNVKRIADYFGVSVEDLRHGDVRAIRAQQQDGDQLDERSLSQVARKLSDDVDALRYAISGLVAILADERPAEGARVAEAIRAAVPENFVMRGDLHALLRTLDKGAAASAGARRGGRKRAAPGS